MCPLKFGSVSLGVHISFEPWENVISKRYHEFLPHNFLADPLKSSFESFILGSLAILSASCAPQLAKLQYGSTEPLPFEAVLEGLQFVLAVLPIVVFVPLYAVVVLREHAIRMRTEEERLAGIELEEGACAHVPAINGIEIAEEVNAAALPSWWKPLFWFWKHQNFRFGKRNRRISKPVSDNVLAPTPSSAAEIDPQQQSQRYRNVSTC